MLTPYLQFLFQSLKKPTELKEIEEELVALVKSREVDYSEKQILKRAKELRNSTSIISVQDYGAGSRKESGSFRKIKNVAKYASIQPKFGRLYARIIKHFNIETAIELGTSLGIGTSFLASTSKNVITIEGCENTAAVAKETFSLLGLKNITLKEGEFSEALAEITEFFDKPCFVYIDGNHRKEATIQYYQFFKKRLPQNSILVFDDIYWSKGMREAWQHIQHDPFFTIDLYRAGIVLLSNKSTPLPIHMRI